MSDRTESKLYEFDGVDAVERLHDMQMSSKSHVSITAEMAKELIPALHELVKIAHRKVSESNKVEDTFADVAWGSVMMARMLIVNVIVNSMPREVSDQIKEQIANFIGDSIKTSLDDAYDAVEEKERESASHNHSD